MPLKKYYWLFLAYFIGIQLLMTIINISFDRKSFGLFITILGMVAPAIFTMLHFVKDNNRVPTASEKSRLTNISLGLIWIASLVYGCVALIILLVYLFGFETALLLLQQPKFVLITMLLEGKSLSGKMLMFLLIFFVGTNFAILMCLDYIYGGMAEKHLVKHKIHQANLRAKQEAQSQKNDDR